MPRNSGYRVTEMKMALDCKADLAKAQHLLDTIGALKGQPEVATPNPDPNPNPHPRLNSSPDPTTTRAPTPTPKAEAFLRPEWPLRVLPEVMQMMQLLQCMYQVTRYYRKQYVKR